ncbi:MAG: hypothetical protein ACXADD_15070 [Candidatus Thorarchaeota archaeon]|jgi:hypothetical protein
MSIEGSNPIHNHSADSHGRLVPTQDNFVDQHLLALRLDEREEFEEYCVLWDDTGESILPLLERLEKQDPVPDYQVRVEF